ncbi:MAG TPA: putative LPS assembly protein LptD [Gemmatimonadales bacterium]|nr:putative LPS assembly protein LptD [Gemmatimonadales bacterium]
MIALAVAASAAWAQVPQQPGGGLGGLIPGAQPGRGLSVGQVGPAQPLDTATARILGLPTGPSRSFPTPDSVLSQLLQRSGYKATRFAADSAVLHPDEHRIELIGKALAEQRDITLEADTITYTQGSCVLEASGEPKLFAKGQVLVGGGIAYNTCTRRGIIKGARTTFSTGSTVWFLRGNVAADSSARRIYAAKSELTSCDLPTPHYHFAARKIKWVADKSLAARSIVLYIRDVPILWLPFIYQDIRPGRHSGILVPQFGFSDIVRPSRSYNRQISNIGYYWATNDYLDVTARLDWFSHRYVQFGVSTNYNVLDRFLSGSFEVSRQLQNGGGAATNLSWSHQQQFNLTTSLNFNANYVSNSFVVRDNALDPLRNTQQISSSFNFTKSYRWGKVNLGGNRRQDLSNNSSSTELPALTISPQPLDIGSNITWSPGFTLKNDLTANTPLADLQVAGAGGIQAIPQLGSSRMTSINFTTPFRIGSFNLDNSVIFVDQRTTGRQAVRFVNPDPLAPASGDSVTISRVFPGDFSTTFDWQTGFSLPVLFPRSWRVVPSVNITNKTGQAFAVRNRNTGGAFVAQGKKLNFALSSTPTLFAFYPGFGPLQRIRHSFAPSISFSYSPAATVSEEFARAIALPGQPLQLRVDPVETVSFGMANTFEGKTKPSPGDTSGTSARKLRLLTITTSPISYDFEQAKKPGFRGWTTQSITNSFLTDLLPNFSLLITHDLWRGAASSDTATFDPFLTSLQTNFTLSGGTFRAIGSIFGLGRRHAPESGYGPVTPGQEVYQSEGNRTTTFFSANQTDLSHQPFAIQFHFTLNRTRPTTLNPNPVSTKNLGFSTAFSPTRFWSLAWAAQYNLTDHRFESNTIQLQRELHDWRAAFNFTRNANGNVALYFSIFLVALPELKFDYNQATIER